MKITESEIQGLKSQEAKDLAVELLGKLQAKAKAPITAGEVQVKELQYELKLKEAAAEDNRLRDAHEQKIKQLELQIEQERTRQAEADNRAEAARHEHASLLERVEAAKESLSIQLEQATREHNLRIERLETDYATRTDDLKLRCDELEQRRDTLQTEINELADLSETADDVADLRETIESRKHANQQDLQRLDEEFAAAEFEKTKKLNHVKREQDLELTELETEHKKRVLQLNQKVVQEMLTKLGLVSVSKDEWEQIQADRSSLAERNEQEIAEVSERAKQAALKAYNITSAEVFDVTDLHYRHQALAREAETLRAQLSSLESEIKRMREHIEQEPQRIANAVEAAKVHIQNNIEQGGKR